MYCWHGIFYSFKNLSNNFTLQPFFVNNKLYGLINSKVKAAGFYKQLKLFSFIHLLCIRDNKYKLSLQPVTFHLFLCA